MTHYYLTQERYDELKKELESLRDEKRKEIAEQLKRAKEYGDLSENAEYAEAREEQARVEARIGELDEMIKSAVIIKKSSGNVIVHVGSTAVVDRDGKQTTYTIVGSDESNPSENKISNESPLGKALLGKKTGEEVMVETPTGSVKYKVVKIE